MRAIFASGFVSIVYGTEHDPSEITREINNTVITCSSSVRLQADASKYFLNSQGINFGQGSGQQVVTSVGLADSYDSIWTIKEADRAPAMCITGQPILCGDMIRLEHSTTGKNLHSHSEFRSALSGR